MKKITKKPAILLMLFVLTVTCTACGEGCEKVRVAALKGPTAMGMVQMMDANPDTYDFLLAGSADEITPKLIKGEVDIAALPANLAAVLYQKTEGAIQTLAVNTLGVLYIVENGETVQSLSDLRGRTIYASGKGSTPEYVLRSLLQNAGIDPDRDVTIEWKSEHSECLAALVASEGGTALLPQPFVTTAQLKKPEIRIALDLNKEWEAQQSGDRQSVLITGVTVVRAEFAKEHPELVSAFLDQYRISADFTVEQPEAAAALIGAYGIVPEEVALKALPYCCIVMVEGETMQEQLSGYLNVLYNQNPEAVGGTLPDESFYYAR